MRIVAVLAVGYGLLYASWIAGYYLLPERALEGWLSGSARIEPDNLLSLTIQILGYNLGLPGLLILALSRMHAGGYSLGYNVPFFNAALYGLWLGTNSFAVPMPVRLAPTLALFRMRSGPYEMAAFMLMAAALARSAAVAQESFWGGATVRIPATERRVGLAEYAVLALAVLLLAAANTAEAWMWLKRIRG